MDYKVLLLPFGVNKNPMNLGYQYLLKHRADWKDISPELGMQIDTYNYGTSTLVFDTNVYMIHKDYILIDESIRIFLLINKELTVDKPVNINGYISEGLIDYYDGYKNDSKDSLINHVNPSMNIPFNEHLFIKDNLINVLYDESINNTVFTLSKPLENAYTVQIAYQFDVDELDTSLNVLFALCDTVKINELKNGIIIARDSIKKKLINFYGVDSSIALEYITNYDIFQILTIVTDGGLSYLYINGKLIMGLPVVVPTSLKEFIFGGYGTDATKNAGGLIGNILIYDRALSEAEIKRNVITQMTNQFH